MPELVGPTTSALNGIFFGSIFLKHYRIKLIGLNVKLTIGDHEDLAVESPRAGGGPLKLQLDAVGGVHQACTAAVHGPVGHGAEIDQQPELVPGQKHLQIHVLCFIFFFHEKAASLRPEVGADDAFVVKHVGRAIVCDSDFGQVGENVFFRVTRARRIRLRELKEDGFHRPPLGVHFYVHPDRFLKVHVVISKLFADRVHVLRFFGQHLAVDHLVFELYVCQLVFQLRGV